MSVLRRARLHEGSFVPGWTVRRTWLLAAVLLSGAFLIGLLLSSRVDLAGLLIVGPCCALLTGRWTVTALMGGLAVGGSVIIATVHRASTAEQLTFVAAVALASLVNALAARWIAVHAVRRARG